MICFKVEQIEMSGYNLDYILHIIQITSYICKNQVVLFNINV